MSRYCILEQKRAQVKATPPLLLSTALSSANDGIGVKGVLLGISLSVCTLAAGAITKDSGGKIDWEDYPGMPAGVKARQVPEANTMADRAANDLTNNKVILGTVPKVCDAKKVVELEFSATDS